MYTAFTIKLWCIIPGSALVATMAITADTLFLLMLLGVATVPYILLRHLFTVKQDPKEPPFLPQKIPFIGHIIGIIRHNTGYYANLTYLSTIQMPGIKS